MPARKPHLKIITGKWRSRHLVVPPTDRTRPMPHRMKESVFAMLASRFQLPGTLPPFRVADMFAGSGSIGLEAISRGVSHCDFFEKGKQAQSALRQNIRALEADAECRIVPADAWIAPLITPKPRTPFGLIFIDPPFADSRDTTRSGRLPILLTDLYRTKWADDDTIIVVHHENAVEYAPSERDVWTVLDRRLFGRAVVTFIAMEPDTSESSKSDPNPPSSEHEG
jgi:16S rRNA (guanine966-N2)-methyltransferase